MGSRETRREYFRAISSSLWGRCISNMAPSVSGKDTSPADIYYCKYSLNWQVLSRRNFRFLGFPPKLPVFYRRDLTVSCSGSTEASNLTVDITTLVSVRCTPGMDLMVCSKSSRLSVLSVMILII